jgi:AraC-like DNA-binding protein
MMLAVIVEEHRCFANAATGREKIFAQSWETVGQAAQLAGMSREGFSRRFRRLQSMPPLRFRLAEKLNDARKLLRAAEPIAAVAAETGFSDQSHLGRCFRRAFGVTPGQYRVG